jgi:signal transduction histidine kinase
MVRALVYEPLLDLHCGPFCGHSPVLLTWHAELAAMLGTAAMSTTIIVCGALGLAVLFGLLRRPHAGSRTNASAILVIGAMVAIAIAAASGLGRVASVSLTDVALVVAAQAGACVAVAVAGLLVAVDRLAVRRNLAEVARLLGAPDDPFGVEVILRRAIGDPGLRVGYWTDDNGYVGADGLPLGEAEVGRQRAELTSRGRPVAVLIHDTDSLSSDFMDEHIGPQARLAIQNESLQLQLRRRVDELRASRRRIVEVGEAERRSLERDLHDGAQQLLLALSFELRRGERAAASAGDATSTALFSGARDAATRTLDELRVLAHGIHPGILTGAGLHDALVSYAATVTPSPKLTIELGGRLSEDAESAVYAIVTRLIQATPGAKLSIKRHAETVSVVMDGVYDAPEYVLDRLGAAGGSSVLNSRGLELVLPCA